jgi:hypothetical protein
LESNVSVPNPFYQGWIKQKEVLENFKNSKVQFVRNFKTKFFDVVEGINI